jgi:lysophospholipase L1-like esterase
VDLYKQLKTTDNKLDPKYADADGLHLNAEGYKIWVNLLKVKGLV